MRDEMTASLKEAMKAGDKLRVETLRMVQAALKNREIEGRATGKALTADDEVAVLQKLVKSRQESAELYDKGGRPELAEKERAEIAIISRYLPQPMTEGEIAEAIEAAIAETGAREARDMGKVIAALKAKHAGRFDAGKTSAQVKAALTRN